MQSLWEILAPVNLRCDDRLTNIILIQWIKDFYLPFRSQVVRSSLLPGILKTLGHNKDHPRPVKVSLPNSAEYLLFLSV